jgi:hypothetical protein
MPTHGRFPYSVSSVRDQALSHTSTQQSPVCPLCMVEGPPRPTSQCRWWEGREPGRGQGTFLPHSLSLSDGDSLVQRPCLAAREEGMESLTRQPRALVQLSKGRFLPGESTPRGLASLPKALVILDSACFLRGTSFEHARLELLKPPE